MLFESKSDGGTNAEPETGRSGLVDSFGRCISYVRISVTDRCDLRCRYCMAERMRFLPRQDILALEEVSQLADIFIGRGVRRIRLTGGEPLVRRGILDLATWIGGRIGSGLDELTLTTNGTRLEHFAAGLHAAGVRRVNVSLDSRRPERFGHITRGRRASPSRSTWSRSPVSTRTRSGTCCAGAPARATTSP